MTRGFWLGLGVALVSTSAVADPSVKPGKRIAVITPKSAFTPLAHDAKISTTIFMDRCTGGCMVKKGTSDDGRIYQSTIPAGSVGQIFNLGEYKNAQGLTGAAADAEWAQVVQCMKEVYSPFNVIVTDTKPTDGGSYHHALVAGQAGEIGQPNGVLGVAPLTGDCSPVDNAVSFSFANSEQNSDRVNNICWTVAQESAHAFGLDHEYEFVQGGRSACNDPMTYRMDCGGEKFFRNQVAKCGTDGPVDCHCGGNQNSHLKILNVFGAGQSIIPAPTASMVFPNPTTGMVSNGISVTFKAFSKRGIQKAELWINGWKWGETVGAEFGPNGQPESTYQIQLPGKLPDSAIDIVAKVYDDLGLEGETTPVSVIKNKKCTDDASCVLDGMTCEASTGKCSWPQPTGEIGESCTYNEFCLSTLCVKSSDGEVCSTTCHPGIADECADGFSCAPTSDPSKGYCLAATDDSGGCCSVGEQSNNAVFVYGGLGAAILGFVMRRRRTRTAS